MVPKAPLRKFRRVAREPTDACGDDDMTGAISEPSKVFQQDFKGMIFNKKHRKKAEHRSSLSFRLKSLPMN